VYTNGTGFGINAISLTNRLRSSQYEKEQSARYSICTCISPGINFLGISTDAVNEGDCIIDFFTAEAERRRGG